MTDEAERKRLAQEKDGFMKSACIAFAANYFALNTSVPHEDVLKRTVTIAERLWNELQTWREQQP